MKKNDRKYKEILARDPRFAPVLEIVEPYPLREPRPLFEALLRAIVGQQISTKAATSIYKRLVENIDTPTPAAVLRHDADQLRNFGLSRQKAGYALQLAEYFARPQPHLLDMPDEELIRELTQIKGIGEWTVQMILIFTLHREDVFAPKDLGIQNAIRSLYPVEAGKGQKLYRELIHIADNWRPYRSWACRYLWPYYGHLRQSAKLT